MSENPAQRALAASTVALIVAGACLYLIIAGATGEDMDPPAARTVLYSLGLASALLLHYVFLGMGAQRLGRSIAAWLGLAVLLPGVGGIAALVLLSWLHDEAGAPGASTAPR